MARTSEYRRFHEKLHKKKLQRMLKDIPMVVYWNNGKEKRYLKTYYYGDPTYKRYSRRKIRRSVDKLPKGNLHHRYFDYWWSIT